MKRIVVLFLVALLGIPAVALAAVISPARIVLTDGDVLFRTPDDKEWLTASVNTPLDEGDELWTPNSSRTEVQLADGTIFRLDGGTKLDLIAVEEGFTHLHLAQGGLYLKTSMNAGPNSLQIDADDTTILPDARTRLRIDMLPDHQEDVSIFKGSAYVEGNGSRTKVRAGEHIALEEGHNALLRLNPPDSWELWNRERDSIQSRATTAESYLPEELRPFSGELDSSGRWVRVPEYGMVWRPTVILSDEWAPYRSGRWIWKGDDYVWISNENWGWLPYHYGRWAVVSGFGWCWVPPSRGEIWGPGYVGWYRNGNQIGWTPLAPGEAFYGRRYYGRYYDRRGSNSINVPANTGAIQYRNRNVRGGFSVVLQNDFLRGKAAFQRPSASLSVSPGSPRIQPTRESRMPIIKRTPPRVLPPEVRRPDNRELRDRFPRVTPEINRRQQSSTPVVPVPTPPVAIIRPQQTQPQPRESAGPHVQQPQPRQIVEPQQVQPQPRQIATPQTQQPQSRQIAVPQPQMQPQPRQITGPAEQLSSRQSTPTNSGQPRPTRENITVPEHNEPPSNPAPADKQPSPQVAPRQGEQVKGQGVKANRQPRAVQQRNVWKVTTTEPNNTNSTNNAKEPRERDSREQQRGR